MAEPNRYEKAKTFDLETEHVNILALVTGWLNARFYLINGKRVKIGTHYEPPLSELGRSIMDWDRAHSNAHQFLLEHGYFKASERDEHPYCAGRLCKWMPTERGMEVIEHVFSDFRKIWPSWVQEHHSSPPIFRDGNELMNHRKGVEVAYASFIELPWVAGVARYPEQIRDVVGDLHVGIDGEIPTLVVEVLTNHNNRQTWRNKFTAWAEQSESPTVWVFENRQTMVYFWNELQGHGTNSQTLVSLDNGHFGKRPSNWSPKKVNNRLERSRRKAGANYDSVDACWTIPGLLEASKLDVHEWAKQYLLK